MDLDWETVKDAEIRYIRGLLRRVAEPAFATMSRTVASVSPVLA